MKDLKLIQHIIAEQNPWWKNHSVHNYLAPSTERPLGKYLWKYILSPNLKRHLVILGPRRVGKTTVMYQTVRHLLNNKIPPERIQWVRLDHPVLMTYDLGSIVKDAIKLAKANKKKPLYLFLDELVYAEKWELWLKTFFDEHWPVHIIASSSATAALQKGKESGVGRWDDIYLSPYTLTELLQLYKKNTISSFSIKNTYCLHDTIKALADSFPHAKMNFEKERMQLMSLGGFPEFLLYSENIKELFLKHNKEFNIKAIEDYNFHKTQQALRSDAIERAIYKDIPQSYRIDYPLTLERLLYILAEQTTGLLSPTEISKDIPQVTVQTLERYINYLCQTYLIFTLPNYASNERDVQRRNRKSYFVDIAIRNAALLKNKTRTFNNPVEFGKLQENLVASHLHHLGKQSRIRLYHWKRGKHEVDLVYDDPAQPLALEVGSSPRHSRSGLQKLLKETPKFRKGCYYIAPDLHFLSAEDSPSGVGALPLDLFLIATGLQQEKSFSLYFKNIEK